MLPLRNPDAGSDGGASLRMPSSDGIGNVRAGDAAMGWRMRWLLVAWPAFLSACVLEMLVFALVDPSSLRWFGGETLDLGPTTVYSLAFFVFWWVIFLAGGITQLLMLSAAEVNSDGPVTSRSR